MYGSKVSTRDDKLREESSVVVLPKTFRTFVYACYQILFLKAWLAQAIGILPLTNNIQRASDEFLSREKDVAAIDSFPTQTRHTHWEKHIEVPLDLLTNQWHRHRR